MRELGEWEVGKVGSKGGGVVASFGEGIFVAVSLVGLLSGSVRLADLVSMTVFTQTFMSMSRSQICLFVGSLK
jgi:hypothetical protein